MPKNVEMETSRIPWKPTCRGVFVSILMRQPFGTPDWASFEACHLQLPWFCKLLGIMAAFVLLRVTKQFNKHIQRMWLRYMHSTRINQKLILRILRTKKTNTSTSNHPQLHPPYPPHLPVTHIVRTKHRPVWPTPLQQNASCQALPRASSISRLHWVGPAAQLTSDTTTLTCSGSTIIINVRFINNSCY